MQAPNKSESEKNEKDKKEKRNIIELNVVYSLNLVLTEKQVHGDQEQLTMDRCSSYHTKRAKNRPDPPLVSGEQIGGSNNVSYANKRKRTILQAH